MTLPEAETLLRARTEVQPVPLLPDVRLYLAHELVSLWQAIEWRAAAPQPPPFWAYPWPGSIALAMFLRCHPTLVAGKSVLDFGSGSGLAAIVAAQLGARRVLAADVDPLAELAQRLNAELNGVTFERTTDDQVGRAVDFQVVLAGDVCYDRADSERIVPWLRGLASESATVLIADPGRHYFPPTDLELLARYDIPTLQELESSDVKTTRIWRFLPE